MNLWIIALIAVGLLAVGGILMANVSNVTAEGPEKLDCSKCGNSCTQDSNCGLQSCGATQGKTCGCGG